MPIKPEGPDTDDLNMAAGVAIDLGRMAIAAEAEPYVTQWFNDTKQAGDTMAKFVLRMIYDQALRHRSKQCVAKNVGGYDDNPPTRTHRSQERAYADYIATQFAVTMGDLEKKLP